MAGTHRMTLWERKERDRCIRRLAAVLLVPVDLLFAAPYLYLMLIPVWALAVIPAWFLSVSDPALIGLLADAGLVVGAVVLVMVRSRGVASTVLGRLGATPVPSGEMRHVRSALEMMTIAAGVAPQPSLWLIDSDAVNALAVGMSADDMRFAVTRGMLENLSVDELTAVFAHLIARVASGDVFADTLSTTVIATVIPSDGVPRGSLPGRRKRSAISLQRADTDAQFLLRNPDILYDALLSIARHDNTVAGAGDLVGVLFVSWPGFKGDLAFIGDDDVRRVERVERLRHEPLPERHGHA